MYERLLIDRMVMAPTISEVTDGRATVTSTHEIGASF